VASARQWQWPGAMMVGLGFAPFQSAVVNPLANTVPVAWGAIGSPIVGLAQSSGLRVLDLSAMADLLNKHDPSTGSDAQDQPRFADRQRPGAARSAARSSAA
jgi:hypothetical protein